MDENPVVSNVIDLLSYRPHAKAKLQCSSCRKQWIAIYPTDRHFRPLAVKCPQCGESTKLPLLTTGGDL